MSKIKFVKVYEGSCGHTIEVYRNPNMYGCSLLRSYIWDSEKENCSCLQIEKINAYEAYDLLNQGKGDNDSF